MNIIINKMISATLLSIILIFLISCSSLNSGNETPVIKVLSPEENSTFNVGDSIHVSWESSFISDSVNVELINEETSISIYSFSTISDKSFSICIDSNMASDTRWQIYVSDKMDNSIVGKSSYFLIVCPNCNSDSSNKDIPDPRNSFWVLKEVKTRRRGIGDPIWSKTNSEPVSDESNLANFLQITEDKIFYWNKGTSETTGFYIKDLCDSQIIIGKNLVVPTSSESLYLVSNDTLLRIKTDFVLIDMKMAFSFAEETRYYYVPYQGPVPPNGWPQEIPTDSILNARIKGDWNMFKMTNLRNTEINWSDDSIKYKLTFKNDSGYIYCNGSELLSFRYWFENLELHLSSFLQKIDSIETNFDFDSLGNNYKFNDKVIVIDYFDTILIRNWAQNEYPLYYPFSSNYYFRRAP